MHNRAPKTKQKANNFGQAMKDLMVYSTNYIAFIIVAIILAIAASVLSILGPDRLKEMTDIITKGLFTTIDMDAFTAVAYVLVAYYGFSFLFNVIQSQIMANVSQKISYALRKDVSDKINKLPLRYFDNTTTGDILSRVSNDIDTIGQTLNQNLGALVSASIMFLGTLFMMIKTNWIMALSGVLASLLGFVFMFMIIGKSQSYFKRQQASLGSLNGHIEEIYSGHNIVKAYNAEGKALAEFNTLNNSLYQSAQKSQFLSGLMMPLMMFVGNLGYVVVCVVGALLVQNGSVTFGVIVAFTLYIRLFTQPLSQLASSISSLQSTAAASERVLEFLREETLPDETNVHEHDFTLAGNVSFKNVRFGYNADRIIINDFTVETHAGQKIAIVGPTGAGKTTMVNLLMKFYEVNSGTIAIDGVSLSDLKRATIHDMFGMVLQDTWLFEGTIRENMIYNTPNVSEETIVAVGKAVGIHHYVETLSKGYDTILDENTSLSVGQKQLITIARAMIKDAPMLILDEATSSVDTRTELLIQKAMDTLMKGRTSFVIAHRLSTIKNADLILVMKDGDVIEHGNHDALMLENGFYAELYNSQFTDDPIDLA